MAVVGSVAVRVTPSFTDFHKSMGQGFRGAARPAQQAGRSAGMEFWKSANSAVSAGGQAIARAVTSAFTAAGRGIGRVATVIGQTFMQYVGRPIASGAATVGRAIGSAFSSAGRWVGDAARTVGRVFMSALPSALQSGLSRLGQTIGSAFSAAGSVVGRAATTVAGVFNSTIAPALSRGASRVSSAVGTMFSGAHSVATRVGGQVADAFSRGLSGIGSAFQSIGPQIDNMGQNLQSIGGQMSGIGGAMTKGITMPAVGAAAAVGGITAALGFGRLVGVDTARAKLQGLGYDAADVERISGMVTDAIDGTMITMAEGTNIAVGALASGVEEGAELERYIRLVGDAANFAGVPIDNMAEIFNRVQGSGKLMLGELNMLERQVPGSTAKLAESYGVSQEAFREMVSAGEVDAGHFIDVMDDFLGGAGEAFADSAAGLAKNALAYVGIIGESILGGAFQAAKEELGSFVEFLSSPAVQEWAEGVGERVEEIFSGVVRAIRGAIEWWMNLDSSTQKWIGAIAAAAVAAGPFLLIAGKLAGAIGSIMRVAGPLVTRIGALATRMGIMAGSTGGLSGVLGILGGALKVLTGPIGWIIAGLTAVWIASEDFRESVFNLGRTLWDSLVSAFEQLWPHVQNLWGSLQDLWGSMSQGGGILGGVGTVLSWVVDLLGWLLGIAIKVAGYLLTGLVVALDWLVQGLTWVSDGISGLIGWFKGLGDSTTQQGAVMTSTWGWIQGAISAVVGWITDTAWPMIQSAWSGISSGAQWLGGIIQSVWGWIQGAISATVDWMTGTAWPMIQAVWDGISTGARILYTILATIFIAIIAVYLTLAQGLYRIYSTIIKSMWEAFASIVRWVWTSIIQPIFGFIVTAFRALGTAFMWVWNNVIKPMWDMFVAIVRWVWTSIVQPIFRFIVQAFRNLGQGFMNTWNGVLKPVFNFFAAIIKWLWENVARPMFTSIGNSFQRMGNFLRSIYQRFIQPMFQRFRDFVGRVADRLRYWFNYIKLRWDVMRYELRRIYVRYIQPIFQRFRDFVNTTRERISNAFTRIRDAWGWLRDRFRAIWVNGIRRTFRAVGNFVENQLLSRIRNGVDAISKAWRKLREWFAKPIIWVIDTVWNDGIKKAFDTVAEAVGLSITIPSVSTSKLKRFATGGAVSGPGTGTSDDILAKLSDGEHVLTAAEVKALGGQSAVYDLRGKIMSGEPLGSGDMERVVSAQKDDLTPDGSRRMADLANPDALPMGNWLWDSAKWVGGKVGDGARWVGDQAMKGIDWVRGKFVDGIETFLKPLLDSVSGFVSDFGLMGSLGSGLIDWGVDSLLNWARGHDEDPGEGGQGLSGMDAFLWALRQVESNGNYTATNPFSDASGAYQFISSTWGGYGGYRRAADAPASVQDARAGQDAQRFYNQYGNWEQAAAAWLYPALAGNRNAWGRRPGIGNPTIQSYVNKVMDQMRIAEAPVGGGPFTANPGGFNRPMQGPITSKAGNRAYSGRFGNRHYGVDIGGPIGTAVRAMFSGVVKRTGGGGNDRIIVLNHGGYDTAYMHNSQILASAGQQVSGGDVIARSGTAGSGPHLHAEYHPGGYYNPSIANINALLRDKGGLMYPGLGMYNNQTGGPEYISNQKQFDNLNRMAEQATSGSATVGGDTYYVQGDLDQAYKIGQEVRFIKRSASRRRVGV